MRESLIENYLVAEVKKLRGEIRKVRWLGRRGAPDRLIWVPHWVFSKLAELKAPGKLLKEHQKREHKRLKKMGFQCHKIDSFEDVDRFLKSK